MRSITEFTFVIIERQLSAFIVRCNFCKGSGRPKGYGRCPVCGGTGKVRLTIPSEWDCNVGVLKCGFCEGTGHVKGYSKCPVCRGVGSLVKCFPRVECNRCEGTGHVKGYSKCPVCGGAGSIWVENLESY